MGTVHRTRNWVARRGKRLRSVLHEPGWPTATLALRRMAGDALTAVLPEAEGVRRPPPKRVIFLCFHNAGPSQMASAFFNAMADPARARALSAGTRPPSELHPEVVRAMGEVGIALPGTMPRQLTGPLAMSASHLVTMGCFDDCPFFAGVHLEDWPLEDARGETADRVRETRDEIRRRVEAMIETNGWGRRSRG